MSISIVPGNDLRGPDPMRNIARRQPTADIDKRLTREQLAPARARMISLPADENLDADIFRGVLRRLDDIDIVRLQDVDLIAADDRSSAACASPSTTSSVGSPTG